MQQNIFFLLRYSLNSFGQYCNSMPFRQDRYQVVVLLQAGYIYCWFWFLEVKHEIIQLLSFSCSCSYSPWKQFSHPIGPTDIFSGFLFLLQISCYVHFMLFWNSPRCMTREFAIVMATFWGKTSIHTTANATKSKHLQYGFPSGRVNFLGFTHGQH